MIRLQLLLFVFIPQPIAGLSNGISVCPVFMVVLERRSAR